MTVIGKHFRIKRLRVGSMISQQKIADALGITQAYWSMIENGKCIPSGDLQVKIARYFHLVNVEDLF